MTGRCFLPLAFVAACAHQTTVAAPMYTCTQVIGVSVTGDWFNAGFEDGLDGGRWQVLWRGQAFIDLWADPKSDLWSLAPQSPCTSGSANPDRVIFTGVNWEHKTAAQWEQRFTAVVDTIRGKYPAVKRIDLLTMLRAPGNKSCGNPKTVVEPYIDEAIAAVAARSPGLVFAGPKVEADGCDVFTKGGPHYTDAGKAAVARAYNRHLR